MHRDRPAGLNAQQQQLPHRQPLDAARLLESRDPLARSAAATLRSVYAGRTTPIVAASALAGLGFVAADNAPHNAAHVEREAQAMVALLLGNVERRTPAAAAAPAADHPDPLS
jgi:hypothetical protein